MAKRRSREEVEKKKLYFTHWEIIDETEQRGKSMKMLLPVCRTRRPRDKRFPKAKDFHLSRTTFKLTRRNFLLLSSPTKEKGREKLYKPLLAFSTQQVSQTMPSSPTNVFFIHSFMFSVVACVFVIREEKFHFIHKNIFVEGGWKWREIEDECARHVRASSAAILPPFTQPINQFLVHVNFSVCAWWAIVISNETRGGLIMT